MSEWTEQRHAEARKQVSLAKVHGDEINTSARLDDALDEIERLRAENAELDELITQHDRCVLDEMFARPLDVGGVDDV